MTLRCGLDCVVAIWKAGFVLRIHDAGASDEHRESRADCRQEAGGVRSWQLSGLYARQRASLTLVAWIVNNRFRAPPGSSDSPVCVNEVAVMSDQTSCHTDFLPSCVSCSSMMNCLPSQVILMSVSEPFTSHVYGSRFWHSIPRKRFVWESHHRTPRRKRSPLDLRKCSSSSSVNPPGPGRQVSSPAPAKPLGIDGLGPVTFKDHLPESALIRSCNSAEDCVASGFAFVDLASCRC